MRYPSWYTQQIWYDLYTDNQGFIGSVYGGECDADADDEEIMEYIAEDLAERESDWEGDTIWGIWNNETINPYED